MSLKDNATHFQNFAGKIKTGTSDPLDPERGQMYYDTADDELRRYNGSAWKARMYTTTTSTSTSTTSTTTSTSTTTTSTSSSSSTSTTKSTSTSTTTTL